MKRKGFTLVELLAVIVILAVIALIAVPMIVGVIEKSRRGALQNSGYGLVEAGNLYNAQYQNPSTVRFDIKDNGITTEEENKLVYKGNVKKGTVLINNKGEVTICINDGKYAAYKNFKDSKITIVDNKTCTIPENSNIVYLESEPTVDISNEELLSRIEELEKEMLALKTEKASQTDVTTAINNLNNKHDIDMNIINNKLGATDISSIGNGTITSAINTINSKFTYSKINVSVIASGLTLSNCYHNNATGENTIQLVFSITNGEQVHDIAVIEEQYRPNKITAIPATIRVGSSDSTFPTYVNITPDGIIYQTTVSGDINWISISGSYFADSGL